VCQADLPLSKAKKWDCAASWSHRQHLQLVPGGWNERALQT
jgi:hypothetical protein